jgi:alpha-mannosidase
MHPARCTVAALVALLAAFSAPTLAQVPASPAPLTLTKIPTLYEVGYSHLDTEWCWSYPQVIDDFIPNTLHQNFNLFDKYPDYIFNWTGANRYKFIKEYYPADYAALKRAVAAGRWYPNGSCLEEGDVDLPSEESVIRQVLYANEFYRKEFGFASSDFMLPDCFGFPASLPSILAHCGIKGFSTQKLTWGSAERTMGVNGIPFNVGIWQGPDGQSVFAALNGGAYDKPLNDDRSNDNRWLQRITGDGSTSGIYADFDYYGVGDRGGAARDSDAANLEASLRGGGPVRVVSARGDQLFNDLSTSDVSKLPVYKGDLLLTQHTSGTSTSEAETKRWNHENEKLADATERASVVADWLGGLPYDQSRITDAWWKFLPGQFHDLMAGTALPRGYEFAWNDQILAMNEFAGVLQEAVGADARALNTEGRGLPIVIYNPISCRRQDVVEASVSFPQSVPDAVSVTGPDGQVVPSQIEARSSSSLTLLILASAPSVGFVVYHVVPAPNGAISAETSSLTVGPRSLENARYRVQLNTAGDVSSIYDKTEGRELLSAPLRLAFQYENPSAFPAWNMDWSDQSKQPEGYVDGPAKITITESGPVRVALTVDRWARGSHFVETIRLSSGQAGNRIEFLNKIDWMSQQCALMAVAPLTVSNPLATYNWELGTIQRSNDDPLKYEVPSHQWFDLTDTTGNYGVSFLTGDRYGSDKPSDNALRLTLLYTPGVRSGYSHQATQDWGHHELLYAIQGHVGSWSNGGTQWAALRFDRPMLAFQTIAHAGTLGTSFSFVHTDNSNVSIEALKQSENSKEIVVRFNELRGVPEKQVSCTFGAPIVGAREVNGQEQPIGPALVSKGSLLFDMAAYRPRAFAVTLASAPVELSSPTSRPLALTFNCNVMKPFNSSDGGSFDSRGNAIPADMLPQAIESDGIHFSLTPDPHQNNAVECKGQDVALPDAKGGRLFLIAASADGDEEAAFKIAGADAVRRIQSWNGMIGQWDDRVWGGVVPQLSYDITNPVIGLKQGFVKRDTVAWYSDHLRTADGGDEAYSYCYLFRYDVTVPVGCSSIQLPANPNIKILAATLSSDPNQSATPAAPLYDTLAHETTNSPLIEDAPASDGQSTTITIQTPLYFSPDSSIHYAIDGSQATANSPVYTESFNLSQSVTISAAYVSANGQVQGVTTAAEQVDNPRPPVLESIITPTPTEIKVVFSEPVSKQTAESKANYQLAPSSDIASAILGADGRTVTLQTAEAISSTAASALTITGVRTSTPEGLAVSVGPISVPEPCVVLRLVGVKTFDGSNDYESSTLTDLPVSAKSPWTINFFAYFDRMPQPFTCIAGFGDDEDNAGAERYIAQFPNGIHFWGGNRDLDAGGNFDVGKWQMITETYDGQTLSLYKDGKLLNSAGMDLTDATPVAKIASLAPWSADRMKGKISGFQIWDIALSPADITALAQRENN